MTGPLRAMIRRLREAGSGAGMVAPFEKAQNESQPPDRIMNALGLEPGMTVGEIGAGLGRMTVWLAARVGDGGLVYANDVVPRFLKMIRRRCRRLGFGHVVTCLGRADDPGFRAGVLDRALMINVFPFLADPAALFGRLAPCLKPDGKLAVVEADPARFANIELAVERERIIVPASRAGFVLEAVADFLPRDNIYIFRKSADRPPYGTTAA